MNPAFRLANHLVNATVQYHLAVRCGDAVAIKAAWRHLCSVQNEFDAACEAQTVEVE